MSIPKEILAIKPKNTRVKATSKPNEYNVISRTCKIINGKPTPVELGIIGKIIDGVFYPIKKNEYDVELKTYGPVAFANKVSRDLLGDLLKFYEPEVAKKLYIMALLRSINENIKNEEIDIEYNTTFISEFYPKVGLSPNTISDFLEKIGKSVTIIERFMSNRIEQYSKHYVVIDGMLKTNTSETNLFSEFSRKGRIKGSKDISLIYAYDLQIQEPLACLPYAGNMLDFTSFRDFISTFPIQNGFLIMDKGFNDAECKDKLDELKTTYLVPMKQNSKVINQFNLNKKFDTVFTFNDDQIRSKKVKVDNKFYYSFLSANMKAMQEKRYLKSKFEKGKFSEENYDVKKDQFGLIVFESNGDLDLKEIYKAYKTRWEIEELFRKYKNIIDQCEENVHGDYRLIATEFINFLSCIITMKMHKELYKFDLLEQYSFPKIIRLLSKCIKRRSARISGRWNNCETLKYIQKIVDKLAI